VGSVKFSDSNSPFSLRGRGLGGWGLKNKRLVKKISVKGISVSGSTATESYFYLERINLHGSKPPTESLEFEQKGKSGVRKVLKNVDVPFNIYEQSGNLDEYKGYTVTKINALSNIVEFSNRAVPMCVNGRRLAGDCVFA